MRRLDRQHSRALHRHGRTLALVLHWLIGLGVVLVLVSVFGQLAEDVWFREGFAWDAPLVLALHQYSRPWLDTTMRIVTQAGQYGAVITACAIAAWFLARRQMLNAATTIISLAGGEAINAILKRLLARPRPALFTPLVSAGGFSFPSGHVTAAVSVYGLLAVFLWRQGHRTVAILSLAVIAVVAVSRVYLGVHYPSDTVGSLAFAWLWLFVVFAIRDLYAGRMANTQATGE
jgi:membrane-associated phospholipid phosphatase